MDSMTSTPDSTDTAPVADATPASVERPSTLLSWDDRDRYVDECPDWCTEDHAPKRTLWRMHGSDRLLTALELHRGGFEDDGVELAAARVRVIRYVREREPVVTLSRVEACDDSSHEVELAKDSTYRLTPAEAVRVARDLLHFADLALGHIEHDGTVAQ